MKNGNKFVPGTMRSLKRIPQEDENGCGVACVAMLADFTYETAKTIMFPSGNVDYTETRELIRALHKLGINSAKRLVPLRTRDYRDLPHHAILKVNSRANGTWHWVVWDASQRQLLDPKVPRYKRLKPVSFLAIQ